MAAAMLCDRSSPVSPALLRAAAFLPGGACESRPAAASLARPCAWSIIGKMNSVPLLDIDEDFNILSVKDRIDGAGVNSVVVKVSTIDRDPMTDEELTVSASLKKSRVFSTHAQLNANARSVDRKGSMDKANPLKESFWMGKEVASVKNVILRFKIDPLRSTVKSVGDTATSTASGGASSPTTSSGGSSSPTTSSTPHSHTLSVAAGPEDKSLGLSSGGGQLRSNDLASNSLVSTTSSGSHSHNVDIPSHNHSVDVPSHTHNIVANISMVYGIYEESGANTLGQADIVIKVNGAVFVGTVSAIAGGWFEADITAELVESDFSPKRTDNVIEYSTGVDDKTAQITTSLAIVDIVQAVSVL